MWKFQYFWHLYSTWNQFQSFWSPKNCHLRSSEFWTFGNFWHLQVCNFSKNQNSKPQNCWMKRQFLTSSNHPKLIWRKILVAGKLLYFHNQKSQLDYPLYAFKIRQWWPKLFLAINFWQQVWCSCLSLVSIIYDGLSSHFRYCHAHDWWGEEVTVGCAF